MRDSPPEPKRPFPPSLLVRSLIAAGAAYFIPTGCLLVGIEVVNRGSDGRGLDALGDLILLITVVIALFVVLSPLTAWTMKLPLPGLYALTPPVALLAAAGIGDLVDSNDADLWIGIAAFAAINLGLTAGTVGHRRWDPDFEAPSGVDYAGLGATVAVVGLYFLGMVVHISGTS
ncbi:hypothetical protein [Salininema proteolyticum]|uniref:Uncharacterized protein n=1 Tax=Salininema proteolyticum TaxID=1607685 RepID=A0ABV8TZE5_9ACTN